MSPQEYHTLKRYAMKHANDPDDQNELVLLAWQESKRLGQRSCMPISRAISRLVILGFLVLRVLMVTQSSRRVESSPIVITFLFLLECTADTW
jgi:hypothetical protein